MSEGPTPLSRLAAAALVELAQAESRLRQGTEILRTGGVVTLRSKDCRALLDEIERGRAARQALGAYRSALRSGEPESEQLRSLGERAIEGWGPAEPSTNWLVETERLRLLERRHQILLDLTNRDIEGQFEQRLAEEGLA